MNKITIGIPTLNRGNDLLINCLTSLNYSSIKPDLVYIIDNGSQDLKLPRTLYPIYIYEPGYNLGVARSWNKILDEHQDWVIIANDDTVFQKETIKQLTLSAESSKELSLSANHHDWFYYSLFLLKKEALKVVGHFDENFYPAYAEDCDYEHRLNLLGYKTQPVTESTSLHEIGGTMQRFNQDEMTQRNENYNKCMEYFKIKWGNRPREGEYYKTPFNLQ